MFMTRSFVHSLDGAGLLADSAPPWPVVFEADSAADG